MRLGSILLLASPLFWGCLYTPYVHEVGGTRMLFESPSLFRAETAGQGTMAFKAELGKKYNRGFNGTTDNFDQDSVNFRPK